MSDRYFTADSIDKKARALLEQLGGYARDFRGTFEPDKAALLVIDMQKYFLEPSSHAGLPSAPAIVPGINQLIAEFSKNNRPIIFTRHLNTNQNAGCLGTWWADYIKEDDPASEIIDDFDTSMGIILKKSQYDAFHETELELILHDNGIEQVVITGVMTHLCCETTARTAFVRGFDVFFTIDGTASHDEGCHLSTLLNLSHGFATPVIIQDLLAFMKGENEG
jgi:isochorismate hydrolase